MPLVLSRLPRSARTKVSRDPSTGSYGQAARSPYSERFSFATRRYLRRRVLRYFRRIGFSDADRYLRCAVQALSIYEEEDIPGRAKRLEDVLIGGLRRRLGDHPFVGEIRGRGLLAGVQLVRSKAPKAFFPPDFGAGRQWAEAAETRGLLVRAIGDAIAICPPLIISESEIAELIDRLAMALGDVEDRLTAVA